MLGCEIVGTVYGWFLLGTAAWLGTAVLRVLWPPTKED